MSIEEFCELTGWPFEEFMDLLLDEAIQIFDFYGLELTVREDSL